MKPKVRPITKIELSTVLLEWAKQEGWKYSPQDVDAYFEINGNDIYALILNEDTTEPELIGCISITKYTFNQQQSLSNFLFAIGMFIIKEKYRGQGTYGPTLWANIFDTLKQHSIGCLNSVPRVTPFYKRKGFAETGINNAHYELKLSDTQLFNQLQRVLTATAKNNNITHLQFSMDNSELIGTYETNLFNEDFPERAKFRNVWLSRSDAIVIAYINNNTVEGYGVLTVCEKDDADNKSFRISPMYSDSVDITAKLFGALLDMALQQNGKGVDLNVVVDGSPQLSEILEQYSFKQVENGETQLMTTKSKEEFLQSSNLSVLHRIIALSPLEFPHEACLIQRR